LSDSYSITVISIDSAVDMLAYINIFSVSFRF